MKRAELRSLITGVCDRIGLPEGADRDALIGSADKIDRIATGQFTVRDDEGVSCGCPALVAGVYQMDPDFPSDVMFTGQDNHSSLFPGGFDNTILQKHRADVVWTSYDEGYIPVED